MNKYQKYAEEALEAEDKQIFSLSLLGSFLILFFFFGIVNGLIVLPFMLIEEIGFFGMDISMNTIYLVIQELLPVVLIIWIVLKSLSNENGLKVGIKCKVERDWKIILMVILSMIGYRVFYNHSLGLYVYNIPLPEGIEAAFERLAQNPTYMLISIVIIAPIIEEVIYRGIFLQGFLNKYNPAKAVIYSAIIFGAIHGNIPQFINATILGLILGYIYYKTDSVMLCILGHMVNNAFVFIDYQTWLTNDWLNLAVGTIIFITTSIVGYKLLEQRYPKVTYQD